mgnify:CR=1 FL=1
MNLQYSVWQISGWTASSCSVFCRDGFISSTAPLFFRKISDDDDDDDDVDDDDDDDDVEDESFERL